MKKLDLVYKGIDDWNRPIFQAEKTTLYFSDVEHLFPYGEDEAEVLKVIGIDDLSYHGRSFDDEPMGAPHLRDSKVVAVNGEHFELVLEGGTL